MHRRSFVLGTLATLYPRRAVADTDSQQSTLDAPPGLSVEMVSDRRVYGVANPVLLKFSVVNRGTKPVAINEGWPSSFYDLHIERSDGTSVTPDPAVHPPHVELEVISRITGPFEFWPGMSFTDHHGWHVWSDIRAWHYALDIGTYRLSASRWIAVGAPKIPSNTIEVVVQ